MKILRHLMLVMVLAPFGVQAATVEVSLNPQISGPVDIDDVFSVEIWGVNTDSVPLIGGNVNLAFDATILNVTAVDVSYLREVAPGFIFDWDFEIESLPVIDNSPTGGSVNNIGFGDTDSDVFNGPFRIATIDFLAKGNGTSDLTLSFVPEGTNTNFEWVNGDSVLLTPNLTNGSAQVGPPLAPVPLPPAVWLLLSCMGLLGFIARRA